MRTASGRLQHHFWGTYCASMVLRFATSAHAADAQRAELPAWRIHPREPRALIWDGDGGALDAPKAILTRYGANPKAIDSCLHSIDYGDPFTITLPEPHDGTVQPSILDLLTDRTTAPAPSSRRQTTAGAPVLAPRCPDCGSALTDRTTYDGAPSYCEPCDREQDPAAAGTLCQWCHSYPCDGHPARYRAREGRAKR